MHAAEASGGEHGDPRAAADRERGTDGRRADCTLHGRRSEVARTNLARGSVEARQLRLGETDTDAAVEHADRRGHGTRVAHVPLGREADGDALSRREAVRHERRLEGDDGAGLAHIGRDVDQDCSSISTNSTSPQRWKLRMCRPVSWKPARSYTLIARSLKAAT